MGPVPRFESVWFPPGLRQTLVQRQHHIGGRVPGLWLNFFLASSKLPCLWILWVVMDRAICMAAYNHGLPLYLICPRSFTISVAQRN